MRGHRRGQRNWAGDQQARVGPRPGGVWARRWQLCGSCSPRRPPPPPPSLASRPPRPRVLALLAPSAPPQVQPHAPAACPRRCMPVCRQLGLHGAAGVVISGRREQVLKDACAALAAEGIAAHWVQARPAQLQALWGGVLLGSGRADGAPPRQRHPRDLCLPAPSSRCPSAAPASPPRRSHSVRRRAMCGDTRTASAWRPRRRCALAASTSSSTAQVGAQQGRAAAVQGSSARAAAPRRVQAPSPRRQRPGECGLPPLPARARPGSRRCARRRRPAALVPPCPMQPATSWRRQRLSPLTLSAL